MPNLIDSPLLGPGQLSSRIDRILFQEKSAVTAKNSEIHGQRFKNACAHLITRRQKVLISNMIIVAGRKLGLLVVACAVYAFIQQFTYQRMVIDIKPVQQLFRAGQQRRSLVAC